ncbi:hypothetical protein A3Q56_00124 [Intoshia linei]|uniref:Uncharacterized protein n=1 Tax=Intoshia linei TaxID=1819745 RepID=A0A177BCZ3_9BILA|nr:hypothetical protein A3Q56_00124 [Intoshia linei]
MKPSRMVVHLKGKHPDKAEKNFEYFRNLKINYEGPFTTNNLFNKQKDITNKELIVSYEISKFIAECLSLENH